MINKYRLLLIVIFLLLGGFFITSFVCYKTATDITKDRLKHQSLPASLDNISSEVQRYLLKPYLIASLMANDTFMIDWILNGETDLAKIQHYLANIKQNNNTSSSFLVSAKTMNYYYPQGILKKVSPTAVRDVWFYRVKKMIDDYESNIDIDLAENDSLTIFINYKVKDRSGKFLGATGVGLKISSISDLLETYKNKYNHDIYFMNHAGEIVLSTRSLNRDKYIKNQSFFQASINKLVPNKDSLIEYKYNNEQYVADLRYLKKLDLYLFVEAREKYFTQKLDDSFRFNFVLFSIVTFVIIISIIINIYYYQKKLERLSIQDKLTSLTNRTYFDFKFDKAFNSSRKSAQELSVILFDIDDFKYVNDTFGHLAGDKVLVLVAEIFRDNFREIDVISRWGGEEFVVLLAGVNEADACLLAERLRIAVASNAAVMKIIKKSLTISLGVATKYDNEFKEDFFARVDKYLYQAKHDGKNRTVAFSTYSEKI
jgi:diguanylate cyclase (GGDEF)-like protein